MSEQTTPIRLNQAMKIKNRILEFIKKYQARLFENSHLANVKPKFDATDALNSLSAARQDLLIVKVLIARANQGIQSEIFELAETKGTINDLGYLNTFEGPKHRPGIVEADEYVAHVSQSQVEDMLDEAEKLVIQLQDTIDEYDAVTLVDIPTRIKELYWV